MNETEYFVPLCVTRVRRSNSDSELPEWGYVITRPNSQQSVFIPDCGRWVLVTSESRRNSGAD